MHQNCKVKVITGTLQFHAFLNRISYTFMHTFCKEHNESQLYSTHCWCLPALCLFTHTNTHTHVRTHPTHANKIKWNEKTKTKVLVRHTYMRHTRCVVHITHVYCLYMCLSNLFTPFCIYLFLFVCFCFFCFNIRLYSYVN